MRPNLTREQVIQAIERKGGPDNAAQIPLVFHKWWGDGLEAKYGQSLRQMAAPFPEDILAVFYQEPGETVTTNGNPAYRWGYRDDYHKFTAHSIGELYELLPDWNEYDLFLQNLPDPDEPGNFAPVEEACSAAKADGRYKLGCWWRLFHERFWAVRGMENMMIDYHENLDYLKDLGRVLLGYYKVIVDRFAFLGFDGIFTSDDLGHQTGPMMSPQIFRELYRPLYEEFIDYVHGHGMHVFLHSCGDNGKLMDDLIGARLDVFHPVQKGCMDERETVQKYGDRITFLAGCDVQHLLPEGSAADVRRGVRELIDLFYKPEGGLLLAAGNGIMPDTPLANIEAMLEEMASYK